MLNFEFLSAFQLTTFVLGIVFSILTIAMVFFTLRQTREYRSTFTKVLFTFILPMITFIMWFACVFAAYEIFNSDELYIMLLAIGCGAALSGIICFIAWIINKAVSKKAKKVEAEKASNVTIEVKVANVNKEENENEKSKK